MLLSLWAFELNSATAAAETWDLQDLQDQIMHQASILFNILDMPCCSAVHNSNQTSLYTSCATYITHTHKITAQSPQH